MKPTPHEVQEVIYRGVWRGVGKLYDVKVESGFTTIIVKPGDNAKQRSITTQEKFARRECNRLAP